MNNKRMLTACVVIVLSISVTVGAATVPWSNPSGENARFGWSLGENNLNPLVHFGSPYVAEAGFAYNHITDFRAEIGSGTYSTSATDVTRVTLSVLTAVPLPAPAIDTITVVEWGEWYNAGEDPGDTSIFSVQADFRINRYVPFIPPPGNTTTETLSPVVYYPDGTWRVATVIDVGGGGSQVFQIQLENIIGVGAGDAGSYIEKLGTQIFVPEPASVLLLGGACIFLLRRPRRSR